MGSCLHEFRGPWVVARGGSGLHGCMGPLIQDRGLLEHQECGICVGIVASNKGCWRSHDADWTRQETEERNESIAEC